MSNSWTDDDQVSEESNGCDVYDALQDGQVAGKQDIETNTSAEYPITHQVGMNVQRLHHNILEDVTQGKGDDERIGSLAQVFVAHNAQDNKSVSKHSSRN